MTETFRYLGELQCIDSDLAVLKSKLEELPKRIACLEEEARLSKSGLETVRHALTDHRKDYKLAELELKAAEEKVSAYSVQLYSAKTNEQYKAFLKEIETQKKLKAKIEDRMIMLMEEVEKLEQKRGAAEKDVARLEVESAQKVTALEAEKREVGAAIAEREKSRAMLVAAIPIRTLTLYERICKSKGGLAVVSTKGERCNGCYNPIPAQKLLEIERQNRLYTCEACGRILIPAQANRQEPS